MYLKRPRPQEERQALRPTFQDATLFPYAYMWKKQPRLIPRGSAWKINLASTRRQFNISRQSAYNVRNLSNISLDVKLRLYRFTLTRYHFQTKTMNLSDWKQKKKVV